MARKKPASRNTSDDSANRGREGRSWGAEDRLEGVRKLTLWHFRELRRRLPQEPAFDNSEILLLLDAYWLLAAAPPEVLEDRSALLERAGVFDETQPTEENELR